MQIEQWNWIMDYCKQRKQNPSDNYFWQKDKHAYLVLLTKGKHE